jgi:hypothetical protein
MSLTHCPLCIGLAVLSVARAIAHLSLLLALLPPAPGQRAATAAIAEAAI